VRRLSDIAVPPDRARGRWRSLIVTLPKDLNRMTAPCSHLPDDLSPPPITSDGCEDCLAAGRRDWVHLRFCQVCGRVGCCDNSPLKHATAHFRSVGHPLIRSYEPGENWFWCYLDQTAFNLEGAPTAPSYRVER
jgi:hypothetical protein